jgi:hypothetical protein
MSAGNQLALPGGSAQPCEGTRDQSMTDLSSKPFTDQNPTLDLCLTCLHPLVAHDRVGLRWCAATQQGVGQRDCICAGGAGGHSSSAASWAQIRHDSATR